MPLVHHVFNIHLIFCNTVKFFKDFSKFHHWLPTFVVVEHALSTNLMDDYKTFKKKNY